jgi:hypothetical protein
MVAEAWYKEEILVMLCWMKVDSSVLLSGRAVDGSAGGPPSRSMTARGDRIASKPLLKK